MMMMMMMTTMMTMTMVMATVLALLVLLTDRLLPLDLLDPLSLPHLNRFGFHLSVQPIFQRNLPILVVPRARV